MSENDTYEWAEGPGKFEGNMFRRAAAYAYDLSLDGWGETVGTSDELGWFCRMDLDLSEQDRVIELGWTPATDAAPEARPVAVILSEDDRGFVSAVFYDSEDAADAYWSEIEGQYDEYYDDEETEGES